MCKEITRKGTRCALAQGEDFCHFHIPKSNIYEKSMHQFAKKIRRDELMDNLVKEIVGSMESEDTRSTTECPTVRAF